LAVSLWFVRNPPKPESMKRKVLFIYAKKMFKQISRRQVILSEEHIARISDKFKMFEKGEPEDKINEVGFARVATIDEIGKNDYSLIPGRYVGIKADQDETPFEDKMKACSAGLFGLLAEEEELTKKVKDVFSALGF